MGVSRRLFEVRSPVAQPTLEHGQRCRPVYVTRSRAYMSQPPEKRRLGSSGELVGQRVGRFDVTDVEPRANPTVEREVVLEMKSFQGPLLHGREGLAFG